MGAPERRARQSRYSLGWRLPVLICLFIVVILATVVWVTLREVERNLVQTAGTRASGAADQLALLLAQSTQQRMADLRRVAGHAAVRDCLQRGSDEACQAARTDLSSIAGTGQARIELWTRAGDRVLSAVFPPAAQSPLPMGSLPSTPGVASMGAYGDVIFSEIVAAVDDEPHGAHA